MRAARVKIVEGPRKHIMERQKRYQVLLDGRKSSELYYNMRGYVGVLPYPCDTEPDGVGQLQLGEVSISAYRREAAAINRLFASKITKS